MKKLEEMIIKYVADGMSEEQAENYSCQEIILNKISQSPMVDNVLIKGGVVIFNKTHNLRRATTDLDFDFIRYDISDQSIRTFVGLLNKYDSQYKIVCGKIKPLHQDDYQGKRVTITIADDTRKIDFKLDIGVHTLLAIKQDKCCFTFGDNSNPILKINPPEQIVAEKLYSLAKHGILSTRTKDVYDIYYFVSGGFLDKKIVKQCLELLTIKKAYNISSLEDVCNRILAALQSDVYLKRIESTKYRWIDIDVESMAKVILDFIYTI